MLPFPQGKVEALKVELQSLDGRKDKGYLKTKVRAMQSCSCKIP